jgi:hypothetical protein
MEEFKKQCVDQPLHWLWGVPTGMITFIGYWLWTPWGAVIGMLMSIGSTAGWFIREKKQGAFEEGGSHVWWDPYLDTGVWIFGYLCGVAGGILLLVFAAVPGAT